MSAQIQILQEYLFWIEISLSNVLQTRHNLNARAFITSKQLLKAPHSFFIRGFYALCKGDQYQMRKQRWETEGTAMCGIFNTFQTLSSPETLTNLVSPTHTLNSVPPCPQLVLFFVVVVAVQVRVKALQSIWNTSQAFDANKIYNGWTSTNFPTWRHAWRSLWTSIFRNVQKDPLVLKSATLCQTHLQITSGSNNTSRIN